MGCSSYSAAAQTFYRRIFTFTADDPQPLVEGGTACMRLTVHGQVRWGQMGGERQGREGVCPVFPAPQRLV